MINHFFPHIRSLDREFYRYMLEQGAGELTAAAAALASFALSRGDVCLNIREVQCEDLWPELPEEQHPQLPRNREEWLDAIRSEHTVGDGSTSTLLTLRNERLYLTRYFRYEQVILERIAHGMKDRQLQPFTPETESLMKKLFRTDTDFSQFSGDLQLAGSLLPLCFPFTIISGGPGTGKTTTVTKLLALLLSNRPDTSIALAAPTGKAAQRMNESIRGSVNSLDLPAPIASKLSSLEAGTIHRLLGVNYLSPTFEHNRENPLPIDLLIVDEASMVDLPLWAKLLDALPRESSIIVLGDQYQLASVEAGSILGDICEALPVNSFSSAFAELHQRFSSENNRIEAADIFSPVVQLTRSFRFDPNGGIGRVSRLINSGDISVAAELVNSKGEVVIVKEISTARKIALSKEIREAETAEEALKKIPTAMILTLLNEGNSGQIEVNKEILNSLKKEDELYLHNMPIMVTENEYNLQLFNGDMGVIRQENGEWTAFFPGNDQPYQLPVVLLPKWQPAFAITIHKSQGSEYSKLMILLGENDSPLLTRELLYTAITRAKPIKGEEKRAVLIEGTPEQVALGIARKVKRKSGITAELKTKP